MPEVVVDGDGGRSSTGDPAAFAAAIGELLADADMRRALGARARALVARCTAWTKPPRRWRRAPGGAGAPARGAVTPRDPAVRHGPTALERGGDPGARGHALAMPARRRRGLAPAGGVRCARVLASPLAARRETAALMAAGRDRSSRA